MIVQTNISKFEDEILNPLNNILLLAYGSKQYKKMEKDIKRVVALLERKGLIHKRLEVINF